MVVYPWNDRLEWRLWNGNLVRPVVLADRLATLRDIEDATELVQPQQAEPWFADHPGSVKVLLYQDIDLLHSIQDHALTHRSDHGARTRFLSQLLEASFVHDFKLYRPARPPTWRVGLYDGEDINITLEAMPPIERQAVGFHFPLHREDAAIAFALEIGGQGRELIRDGTKTSWLPGMPFGDAAFETASSMARSIIQKMSRDMMTTSPGHIAFLLGALKAMHDSHASPCGEMLSHGDDGTIAGISARDVLEHFASAPLSELMPDFSDLHRCLRVRDRLLAEFDALELAGLAI